MNHRPERVSGLIMAELGKLILKEIEVEGALPTITEVDVSDDLARAIVKVSVYPTEKSEEVEKQLNKLRSELQWQLLKKMNIRPMPRIEFEIDYGQEYAAKIEKRLLESEGK
ncbi:MAG: ribosome-binding factor A [Parcubacteria group bacterium Gr01-1014_19]|nr:MAG: ribosome-binding factor A [Parcubacteria group bacterium Gr01-1014_19]